MAMQFTHKELFNLSETGRYYLGGTGLHFWVKPNGNKYWVFRYTYDGKRCDLGLGSFPKVSVSDARKAAANARNLVDKGENPVASRRVQKQAQGTEPARFKDFAATFIETKKSEFKNSKHAAQWSSTLKEYAYPVIGDMDLESIETRHVLEVLTPIWNTKTETATRVRGRLERIFAAAKTLNLRTTPNPAIWRGHLDTILPKPRKITSVKHHQALPFNEVTAFISTLHSKDCISALTLEFTILTAARTGEVIKALRHEVSDGVWIIPATRMKAGVEHRVPLTPRVLEILAIARARDPESKYLFSINGKSLSNMAMLNLAKSVRAELTVHGFRSAFRDWVSELTDHSPELAEMALAHTIKNRVEAAYRRGDLFEKRRVLMTDWAAYCAPKPLNVTYLKSA